MKSPIFSLPVEILTRIFESCDDFLQVVALASTCKHAHTAWVTNSPIIIWGAGKSQIRSFDDALMAVRATAIVLKAYQAGILPPAIGAIDSLSGNAKPPDLAELKEVLSVQHLVRCIEYTYFNLRYRLQWKNNLFSMEQPKYPASRRRFPDCLKEIPGAENATIDSFRDRFFRTMYRLLLAGAVLARAYVAPVFDSRAEGNFRFFQIWGDENYWSEEMAQLEDREYWSKLGQWRNREYETLFGPFASWIVEDGRRREQNEPQALSNTEPAWAENRVDIGAVREVMLLLVAYDHFNDSFENYYGYAPAYLQKQGNKTVSIVRFGIFKVEEITMPAAAEDLTDTPLVAQYHPTLEGTAGEDIKYQIDMYYITWMLEDWRRRTDIPCSREHP
ncbi:hypothetical protein F5884DRAFT_880059 [Xylogone sp. PMI_703]|nr:hypothetical protein F5884DRAFT_880059 [Xylogone sp. PMI_703]